MESDSEGEKTKKKSLKPVVADPKETKIVKVIEKRKTELSLKDVIKHTSPFDGSNFAFKEWADMLERNITLANLEDNFGEILFGAVLINKAKVVWEMAEVNSRVSIKASFKLLKSAFDNSSTRLEAEEKIHSTKQASFNTVIEYVKEQVKNCKAVNGNMSEEAVIAHIRRNLSPDFKKQLYLFEFKSIDQFILVLDKVEKNCSPSDKVKTEVNFVHSGGRRSFHRGRGFRGGSNRDARGRGQGGERNSGYRRGRGFSHIQCYNCGNFGHMQSQCRSSKQVKLTESIKDSRRLSEKFCNEDAEDVLPINKEEDSLYNVILFEEAEGIAAWVKGKVNNYPSYASKV